MYIAYIMKHEEALTRTQIYLTQAQQAKLSQASRGSAASKSALIRLAIDQFLEQQSHAPAANKALLLQDIAGMWTQRTDMADPATLVRQLRKPRFD